MAPSVLPATPRRAGHIGSHRMQLLEKLGLRVEAETDGLVKVGVGLDPRRKTLNPDPNPKPNQVRANGIWPARTPGPSRSGPSAGQPHRPPAKGTKGRGAEDAQGVEGTRSRGQGGHGGGTGSGGVEQSGQRAQRGGGRRGARADNNPGGYVRGSDPEFETKRGLICLKYNRGTCTDANSCGQSHTCNRRVGHGTPCGHGHPSKDHQ